MKARYLVAAAAAALALGSAADAAIFVSVIVDGVELNPTFSATAVDAGSGVYNSTLPFTNATSTVAVSLQATGKGSSILAAPDPQFITQALTVDASGSHTVRIRLSQTGLTSAATVFAVASQINALTGTATSSAAAYVGANTAFAETTAIGSALTCATGVTNCQTGTMIAAAAHPATFSETVEYNLAITDGRVQLNTQIAAAPEPATWGLMVLGFGAVGAALRTSRRKVVFA